MCLSLAFPSDLHLHGVSFDGFLCLSLVFPSDLCLHAKMEEEQIFKKKKRTSKVEFEVL